MQDTLHHQECTDHVRSSQMTATRLPGRRPAMGIAAHKQSDCVNVRDANTSVGQLQKADALIGRKAKECAPLSKEL